jgi:hypothetical protein
MRSSLSGRCYFWRCSRAFLFEAGGRSDESQTSKAVHSRGAIRTPAPPNSTVLLMLRMTVMEGLVNVAWSRAFLWLVSVERLRRPLIAFDDCREWRAIRERPKKLVYLFVGQLRRPDRKFRQSWKSGGRIMRSSGSALIYLRVLYRVENQLLVALRIILSAST